MTLTLSRTWLYAIALPFCLIMSQVFIDLAHGIMGASGRSGLLSIGVVIRGLLAVLSVFFLVRFHATILKTFLVIFLIVFLVSNLVWIVTSYVYSFAHEINQAMRIAFPWLVSGIFLYLHQKSPIDQFYLLKVLAWAGFLTAVSLLASTALGIEERTHGDWSYGSKGLFSAQNDLGLTLILTLVAAVVVLVRTRRFSYLIITTSIIGACLLLGTRTGILGPVLIVLMFGGALFLNPQLFALPGENPSWRASLVLIVPLLVAIVMGGLIFTQFEKTNYLIGRIYSLTEQTPRSKLEAAGIARLEQRRAILTLVGEGGLAFKKHVAENIGYERKKVDKSVIIASGSNKMSYSVHRVENDVIDILGFYGFAQFFVIYGALGLVYLIALRKAIRDWSLENVAILMILTLFLAHSTLAGHGIFSAQVAMVLAPVLFLQLRDLRWGPVKDKTPVNIDNGSTRR